ncbi:protein of unknown function [Xenorhabdus doucetiae]|uniref:Uncharacterized protein n=1 Tax=Xenorhabdus doucetiae TaxID=351671 RepID=A0A068QN08_9GAMM|nr:protein of unknown function [Xenorhabdus doucetiae]
MLLIKKFTLLLGAIPECEFLVYYSYYKLFYCLYLIIEFSGLFLICYRNFHIRRVA